MKKWSSLVLLVVMLALAANSTVKAQVLGQLPVAKHSAGVDANGSVYTWGYNEFGQLGDNTTTNSNTPVRVLKGAYSGTTYWETIPPTKLLLLHLRMLVQLL